jgi:hypothetical protein
VLVRWIESGGRSTPRLGRRQWHERIDLIFRQLSAVITYSYLLAIAAARGRPHRRFEQQRDARAFDQELDLKLVATLDTCTPITSPGRGFRQRCGSAIALGAASGAAGPIAISLTATASCSAAAT